LRCKTDFYSASAHFKPYSSLQKHECLPCDPSCTHGCWGPSISDCKVVPNESTTTKVVSPYCLHYDKTDNCDECELFPLNVYFAYDYFKNNFIKSPYYYCSECLHNCRVCTSQYNCVCWDLSQKPFLSFDMDFNVCRFGSCPDNCVSCDVKGVCNECEEDHKLVGNECFGRMKQKQDCLKIINNECQLCAQGYVLSFENLCVKCPGNCSECQIENSKLFSKMTCLECESSFFLYEGGCIEFPLALGIGKLNLSMNNRKYLHKLALYTESLIPSNCKNIKNFYFNSCVNCEQNYFLNSNNQCNICSENSFLCKLSPEINEIEIIQCTPSYYFNPKTNSCVKCKDHCLKCSPNGCLECFDGYSLFEGTCVACVDPNCLKCRESS
jgi:hypothetical protein